MAVAVPIVMAVGAMVSAYAQYRSSQQQQAVSEYQADVYETEAIEAEKSAKYNEDRHRESIRSMLATQRALYGASGVDLASGSASAVMLETKREGELDALQIRRGGEVDAVSARNKAMLERYYAKSAKRMMPFQVGSTLLSGAASAMGAYSGYAKTAGTNSYYRNYLTQKAG